MWFITLSKSFLRFSINAYFRENYSFPFEWVIWNECGVNWCLWAHSYKFIQNYELCHVYFISVASYFDNSSHIGWRPWNSSKSFQDFLPSHLWLDSYFMQMNSCYSSLEKMVRTNWVCESRQEFLIYFFSIVFVLLSFWNANGKPTERS